LPRTADAIARAHSRVVEIREGQFKQMLGSDPHFALSMMRVLTDHLRSPTPA
jgi:CRP-like cAMP-binding protein